LQQYFAVIEQSKSSKLLANSILNLGRILRRLQDWEKLQSLADKALQVHKTENKSLEIAEDYGFLAEVALAKKRWGEAQDLARKALEVSATVPTKTYAPSLYHFLLAQAQHNLNQPQDAISNLVLAKDKGSPEYDTQLYIDILVYLHRLYFEQKQYFPAFEIKLERLSIEQQYGLRAFVGAGRIQPQRQAKLAATQVVETLQVKSLQENIAPEIAASGRQLDVERLIERIGRNDYKLIVIHGLSGVGKSSLVTGGLIPALRGKAIGTQDVLPVILRVYTDWVGELGRLLMTSPPAPLLPGEGSRTADDLLEGLGQNELRNLRTVLIFDQFEEFFFVYPNPGERRRFFEFLGECLKILSVKIILSLREDYLHYLLECNRLDSMGIIGNDILSKNVLYPVGNFAPDDAREIILQLTEHANFHLESDLIAALVKDLAAELGSVRPIEMQVVGAQLQTENITTLAKYRQSGTKSELVQRYLDAVVRDCGDENKQLAQVLLYLLTDEKGTRPLKTRGEIERDWQDIYSGSQLNEPPPRKRGGGRGWGKMRTASQREAPYHVETETGTSLQQNLDLILQIFVGSGLVVLIPENPADRYQLVHDYIAAFIRQQQEPQLKQLMAELERKREKGKRTQEQLNRTLKRALFGAIAAGLVLAGVSAVAVQKAIEAKISEIETLTNSSEAFFVSDQNLDALKEALKAGREVKLAPWITADTRMKTTAALRQAVYLQPVKYLYLEQKRLTGHSARVWGVSFSPDGKTIASASVDKTVKLWSRSGKLLTTLNGHSASVWGVSFSPDGETIASASWDKTVILWDLNFEDLLASGCHVLHNHLILNPETLAELKQCQKPDILAAASPELVAEGEELARNLDIDGAVAKFRQAQQWNPKLDFDPQAKAEELANKTQAER
jgi:tetratricopeptide (TPR) repeat protein